MSLSLINSTATMETTQWAKLCPPTTNLATGREIAGLARAAIDLYYDVAMPRRDYLSSY
jgi:hypothetical protein